MINNDERVTIPFRRQAELEDIHADQLERSADHDGIQWRFVEARLTRERADRTLSAP
jgi:hypothetical protein